MKIKTKLILGFGLLFALVALLSVVSIWYINALKTDTNNILTANYNTLEYSRSMIIAIDKMKSDPQAYTIFESNLAKQKKNETEPGETQATQQVALHFAQLKENPGDTTLRPKIRTDISELMWLNMQAIQRKSKIAAHTAETATLWIAVTGTLCFLIAFVSLMNLPGNIANPIRELTESIKQIAAKNYHQRVHFGRNSEFGELANSFNVMAEKLEEFAGSNLAKLLVEKQRIESLINNMKDPVIGLDEHQIILFVNNEALKISGLRKEDIIGRKAQEIALKNDLIKILIRDIIYPSDPGANRPPMKIYADHKESYFEKEIITINVIPTGEIKARKMGHVLLLRNVTPFKELDFAKTNFIATISHELKTPISSIKMGVQLLEHDQTGKLNKEQRELIEGIKDDSKRLLKITGELLDMSRVETGNVQLNMQRCNPYLILQYATEAIKVQAEQKELNIQLLAQENLPDIKADSEKTAWILTNFLTNAIRYSPELGDIILSLQKEDEFLVFSVKDFGPGIEKRYRGKIFDRYFQVPGSARSGTGLGLAISKEFIEAQGGIIGVESEEGMGSSFFFKMRI